MAVTILLFDVDGVLIQPGGYRAAVRVTVNHFTNQMGLGDCAPDDATIAIFEAQGITCEWDMVPLLLAVILETLSASQPDLPLGSFDAAVAWLGQSACPLPQVNFPVALRQFGSFVTPGVAPAESVLAAAGYNLFPHLAGQGLLRDLLSSTRRPALSPTTALFETFALGDDLYTRSMGLPAPCSSPSLLTALDRPLLRGDFVQRLNRLHREGKICMAACTARPSQPLGDHGERLVVYAPEAELALELVGLEGIALVGTGQTGAAARQLGENEERLTKPAPYHALMAAAAALSGDRAAAADWTMAVYRFVERGGPHPGLQVGSAVFPGYVQLHMFEDSPGGLAGVNAAALLLRRLAVRVDVFCWGISTHPEKQAALRAQGAQVFEDINAALDQVFKTSLCV